MVKKMNAKETPPIKSFCGCFTGSRGGSFFKKGGGTPNPFTVRLMQFFRGFISKVCRKNKVSEGISKKCPPLAAGGKLADIIFILLAIMIAFGLKHHYSQASVDHLNWILAPTVELVDQLSGITFEQEAYSGFISKTHRIIIAKSCAGVNFLIIAFCMLIFSRVRATKPVGAKILLFIKSIITAYFLTIIVNALRIILGIYLYNADIYGGWLTREMLHRIEGTAIYFIFLCVLYFVLVPRQCENKSTARRAIKTPLFWYLMVTLFVPLVRRSLQGNLSGFFQHSVVVMIILIIIVFFFFLFKSIVRSIRAAIQS